MDKAEEFNHLFEQLKSILVPYQDKLDCVNEIEGEYYLNTRHIMKNKKPLFFAAVNIGKNYVSFHLMPVYVFPELLSEISPELKKRMQGKSCFNFKKSDALLFEELAELTAKGFARYQRGGYV